MTLQILSLGAGVQSTTLALMAARGEFEKPDAAIFADTGWEPPHVYKHLDWLETQLDYPIHRVSAGNLRDDLIARSNRRSKRFVTVPFFLRQPKGRGGIGRRQCTSHYKVEPIRKKVRELLGYGPRDRVPANACEKWLGISLDEVIRATPSKIRFEVNRFPLLEMRMSRQACLRWMEERQYPRPPKSSCIGCPYHDNTYWRDMRDNDPASWRDAIEVDAAIRKPVDRPGVPAMKAEQFMHRDMVPLAEADLRSLEDMGQLNLFNEDCEGMCGV